MVSTPVEWYGLKPKTEAIIEFEELWDGEFVKNLTKALERHLRDEAIETRERIHRYWLIGAGPDDIGSPGNTPDYYRQKHRQMQEDTMKMILEYDPDVDDTVTEDEDDHADGHGKHTGNTSCNYTPVRLSLEQKDQEEMDKGKEADHHSATLRTPVKPRTRLSPRIPSDRDPSAGSEVSDPPFANHRELQPTPQSMSKKRRIADLPEENQPDPFRSTFKMRRLSDSSYPNP